MKHPLTLMEKLAWGAIGLIALTICLAVIDCSAGKTRYFEASISGHHYSPDWVEVNSYTDSDGHTTLNTIHHPEEFHILCAESGGLRTFDVLVSRDRYYNLTDGAEVTVCTREGKWTHSQYLPSIE